MPERETVIDEIRNQSNNKIPRCHPCIRFGNIFFSIILTLYGAGILLLTITVRTNLNCYIDYLHYYLETPVLIMLLTSKVIIGIGSLGFISSACFIYRGIVTFGVLVFGLLMFKLSIGIVVMATMSSAENSIKEALELSINNYTSSNSSIALVQTNLYCCGVDNYTDWHAPLGYIPGSCCGSDTLCEAADVIERSSIGCYEALLTLIEAYIYIYIATIGILVAFEIGAIAVTILLVRDVKRNERRVSPYQENSSRENSETPEVTKIPGILKERKVPSVTKNPMAARSNLLDGSQSKNDGRSLPQVKLPVRRLASFNYPINSHRVIPTAPPMPGTVQRNPRIF